MKRIIFPAMILVAMTSAGCAGFKADLAAADARREARVAKKHGGVSYGKKQIAEKPEVKVDAPAPVVTE